MLRVSLSRNWKILPLKETDAVNRIITYNFLLCKIIGKMLLPIAEPEIQQEPAVGLPSSMPLTMLSLLVLGALLALFHSTTYVPLLSSASLS